MLTVIGIGPGSESMMTQEAIAAIREAGHDPQVIEYLKTPPTRDELSSIYARAGMSAREGLRAKEALADELGLGKAFMELASNMLSNPARMAEMQETGRAGRESRDDGHGHLSRVPRSKRN